MKLLDDLSEKDTAALKSAVKDAVINEYLHPNKITPEDFTWPDRNSSAWQYFGELVVQYIGKQFLDVIHNINPSLIPVSPDKEIIDAAFHGFITWFEIHGDNNYENFAVSVAVLQPYNYSIPAIDLKKCRQHPFP